MEISFNFHVCISYFSVAEKNAIIKATYEIKKKMPIRAGS